MFCVFPDLFHLSLLDAMTTRTVFVLALLAIVNRIDTSSDAMRNITSGFLKVLEICKSELNLTDHILSDFYHYWKEDYSLLNRETGCAIVCMSQKLNLLDASGKIHHGNTQDFAKQHGAGKSVGLSYLSPSTFLLCGITDAVSWYWSCALTNVNSDDGVASKLVELLHECEKQHDAIEDNCMRALEVAKCFRTSIHQLKWTPTLDVIVTEVLTDV